MSLENFTEVPYGYGQRWMHKSGRAWIQLYPETHARRAFFQAYVSVGHLPKGRDPETCNNRRLGSADPGFATAEAAAAAIEGEASNVSF